MIKLSFLILNCDNCDFSVSFNFVFALFIIKDFGAICFTETFYTEGLNRK